MNGKHSPVSSTAELLDAVATGRTAHLAELLADALQAHVIDGADLQTMLGLDRLSRIRARNAALTEAAAVLAPGAASSWEVACRLSDAVHRFESRVWPSCRRNPDGLGPLDASLRVAFLTGQKVPSSVKRLLPFTDAIALTCPLSGRDHGCT